MHEGRRKEPVALSGHRQVGEQCAILEDGRFEARYEPGYKDGDVGDEKCTGNPGKCAQTATSADGSCVYDLCAPYLPGTIGTLLPDGPLDGAVHADRLLAL